MSMKSSIVYVTFNKLIRHEGCHNPNLEFAFKIGRKEGVLGVEDKPKLWHK
jgi:hypothetical protein